MDAPSGPDTGSGRAPALPGLAALVLALAALPHDTEASPPAGADSPRITVDVAAWRLTGRLVQRSTERVELRDAVAVRRATPVWTLRADRLVWRFEPTLAERSQSWYARGRVRLIGPAPLYVVADEAVSFAPARTAQLTGRSPARLVGADWTLAAGSIAVDIAEARARLRDLGTNRPAEAFPSRGRRATISDRRTVSADSLQPSGPRRLPAKE